MTIEQSYKNLGLQVKGSNYECMEIVSAWALVASLTKEWLLIVNGADDVDALSRFSRPDHTVTSSTLVGTPS